MIAEIISAASKQIFFLNKAFLYMIVKLENTFNSGLNQSRIKKTEMPMALFRIDATALFLSKSRHAV